MAKNLILWVVIAIVLMSVFSNFQDQTLSSREVPYSEFLSQVKAGDVDRVTFQGQTIRGVRSNGEPFSTYSPETNNEALIGTLLEHAVQVNAKEPEGDTTRTTGPARNRGLAQLFTGLDKDAPCHRAAIAEGVLCDHDDLMRSIRQWLDDRCSDA